MACSAGWERRTDTGLMGDGVHGQSCIGVSLVTRGWRMRLRMSTGRSRIVRLFASVLVMMTQFRVDDDYNSSASALGEFRMNRAVDMLVPKSQLVT